MSEPLDLTGPNPLGLKLLGYWPEGLTKGELAKLVLPEGLSFDYALPQDWLDHESHGNSFIYEKLVCQCVWIYPKGSVFGYACNLVTGKVWL